MERIIDVAVETTSAGRQAIFADPTAPMAGVESRTVVLDTTPDGGPAHLVGGAPWGLDTASLEALLGLGPEWTSIIGPEHGIHGLGYVVWTD